MKNLLIFCCVTLWAVHQTHAAERPNILWITAEDMSPVLGCYGDKDAITPHIDKLAKRSTLYHNAFATAPVCSPSRSCLINGLSATSQGTHNMRSIFPLPSYMKGFPAILRQAGYFTSNNVKTDYNSANLQDIIKASWTSQGDKAHWQQRQSGQAFFSIFNLMTSHQSRAMVWPYEKFIKEVQSKLTPSEIHDPASISLPPYYPNTPVIRKTQARFYDCVTAMDKEVGAILDELKSDGLDDDTIVFFYRDHGSGMPRHKRALLDSGMKVAMMIHIPQKWQHLVKTKMNSNNRRLINFADFAPTILQLLGLKIPDYMEGQPFLNTNKAAKKYIFGHRDRVDEAIDMARSVRSQRYLYIRNFMPHLGYNQKTAWADLGDIRHEFYAFNKEAFTPAQRHFTSATRPAEELYDCQNDPQNLHNLIDAATHNDILNTMRQALKQHVIDSKDLGFLPEAMCRQRSQGTTPYEMARQNYPVEKIYDAANKVGMHHEDTFLKLLNDKDSALRYWATVGLCSIKKLSEQALKALQKSLSDKDITVRIQAADALLHQSTNTTALKTLAQALKSENFAVVLHAARTIENLAQKAFTLKAAMLACDKRMKNIRPSGQSAVVVQPGKIDMAMFIGFSTNAFLTTLNK